MLFAGNKYLLLKRITVQSQYLKTIPKSDLIQNKVRSGSLGTDWIENKHFVLVFPKMIVFTPKTGSINSGTVVNLPLVILVFVYE
jgi:hypothetical protein